MPAVGAGLEVAVAAVACCVAVSDDTGIGAVTAVVDCVTVAFAEADVAFVEVAKWS